MSSRIGLIGAGAAASGLAPPLRAAGFELACWARDPARAATVARPVVLAELAAFDLVWILVSDDAIGEVAARLAEAGAPPIALHGAGFHGPEVLAPLAATGAAVGALHPLVSFPPGADAASLEGAAFALAGDGRARAAGRALVAALDGHVLDLAEGSAARAAYHAAAALTANGLVALLDLALETLAPHADRADAARALAHLGAGALRNVSAVGTGPSLTGPVARGDAALVAGHLDALGPDARAAYRLLARRMLALAEGRGLDSGRAAAVRDLLAE